MMAGPSGIQAITKQGSVEMTVIWVVVGVVVAAGAATAGFLWWRHRARVDQLSRLVAEALEAEWAERLGTDPESVRSAVLRGQPPDVRDQLAGLVSDVEVAFEFTKPGPVDTIVRCRYADDKTVTTVKLRVPWEQVPQPVRAGFLRAGTKQATRHWSVLQPA